MHHLQLEAGKLHHCQVIWLDLGHLAEERISNIPSPPHMPGVNSIASSVAGCLGHAPHQGGGGGFSCRASNANHFAWGSFQEYLRIIAEWNPTPQGFLHQWQL